MAYGLYLKDLWRNAKGEITLEVAIRGSYVATEKKGKEGLRAFYEKQVREYGDKVIRVSLEKSKTNADWGHPQADWEPVETLP